MGNRYINHAIDTWRRASTMNADEADDFACLLDADFLASLSSDIDVSSVRAHFQIDTSQDARVPEPTRAAPHESPPTPTQPAPMGVDNYLQITGHSQKWTIGKIIAESEKATAREAVGHDGRVAAVKILPLSHRDNDRVDQEAAIVVCSLHTQTSWMFMTTSKPKRPDIYLW